MAQFQVSTAKLTEEAAHLSTLNSALEQKFQELTSISNQYLNMWEGEAKQAFVNSVVQNRNLLSAFTNNMNKFVDALNQGASAYEKGEQESTRIAANKGQ